MLRSDPPPCARWLRSVGAALLLALALLMVPAAASAAAPEAGARLPLDSGWAFLLDPASTLDPATLSETATQGRFKAKEGAPSLGYIQGTAWLRKTLVVPEGAGGPRLLELQFPPIDEATLFWPGPQGLQASLPAGDRHPLAHRDVAHRNIVFKVSLQAGQEHTFYLRLRGSNTMNFSVVLWEPEAFNAAAMNEQLAWGLVLALHLVLTMSNLWFFQATRDAPYGLFGLFTLVSFLSVLFLEGFGYRYLLDGSPRFNDALVVVSWMFAQPMAYLFVLRFTGLLGPGGRPWARALVAGLFLFSLAMLLADQLWAWPGARPAFTLVHLASVPLLAGVLAAQASRGQQDARLMLWAMLPVMAAVALRLARNLGWLPPHEVFDHGYYVGLMLYLLILNFAVSRRYEGLRRESEAAKARALETVREFAQELESRVAQRTAEIAAAMGQVQGALALERRLRADQRTFFATVSHELRTPLAVIDATAQNLSLQKPPPDGATRARLLKIVKASERMATLLNQHLQDEWFSGKQAGPRAQPCDVPALLRDAAASVRLLSDEHALTVSADGLDEPFLCDVSLTRLALGNLVDNAIKHTPEGTRVALAARAEGEGGVKHLVIQVSDDGPGLPPDQRDLLFKSRFRGSASGHVPGSGTGLLLARQMVEVQGGTLDLRWPPAGGTVATIRLPSRGTAAGVQPAQANSIPSPKA